MIIIIIMIPIIIQVYAYKLCSTIQATVVLIANANELSNLFCSTLHQLFSMPNVWLTATLALLSSLLNLISLWSLVPSGNSFITQGMNISSANVNTGFLKNGSQKIIISPLQASYQLFLSYPPLGKFWHKYASEWRPVAEMFIWSKLGQNLSEMEVRTFARIKKVIWDQLLATKAEIIQSKLYFRFACKTPRGEQFISLIHLVLLFSFFCRL